MKHLLLCTALFSALVLASTDGMAQEKNVSTPLFITPYTANVPTYNNRVPSVVTSTGQSQLSRATRTYTSPNRVSKPLYDTSVNQFPADFGRITGEQDFYDTQTKRYYGQYEYFALLANRGDTATLQQALQKVQSTGVFDPEKYKAVMSGGTASSGQSGAINGGVQRPAAAQQRSQIVTRQNEIVTPQRIHQGYDDDMNEKNAPQAAPQRQKNAPIFLR